MLCCGAQLRPAYCRLGKEARRGRPAAAAVEPARLDGEGRAPLPSPAVRAAAFDALDDLFPAGAAPRKVVAVLAAAWAWAAALWASTGAGAALAAASGAGFGARGVASVVFGVPLAVLREIRKRIAAQVDCLMRANVMSFVLAVVVAFEGVVGRMRRRRWRGWRGRAE